MAGEIQLNSTTMATESSGSITAQLDTIRPNTTNGNLTLQGDSSDAGVTGLTIDSSGNATFAQTISGGTIGSSVVFPAAHPVQVKTATTDQVDSFNTSGFQDVTGLSVDITPKLGSKILIYVEFRYGNSTSSNNGVQLLRNATALDLGGSNSTNLGNVNNVSFMDTSFTYYDSPNTDQQITYKLQVQRSAGTLYINGRSDGTNDRNGTILAMEIV